MTLSASHAPTWQSAVLLCRTRIKTGIAERMPITVPPDTGTTAGIRGFFMHASGSTQAGSRKKTTVF